MDSLAATPWSEATPRSDAYSRPHGVRGKASARGGDSDQSSSHVAHTLTACTRCRQRKTRCDPGLPRCGPCERTNALCEYYDAGKGTSVNRSYVVFLQHRVRDLERELSRVESEDGVEDPEAMMRAATVRVHETAESKFLGPSSGIAITRLVMQLAKQFADVKSIKDLVSAERARHIKELYSQEQAKPTSKIYPLISDVAAEGLPNRPLVDALVHLYKLRVQPLYPALHEPTLDKDIDELYQLGDTASPYQQFVGRMVIAISLQKMDTQYAGLADSYYLAALQHLTPVVKPMNLATLQCFALMAEYSLLTPTRTAIYYVLGIAVRLAQTLGLHEEKSIVRSKPDGTTDFLEIDMRRRLFWCILVMELALAHVLGRPSMLAVSEEHIDVGWFETCDDEYITPQGIDPSAPRPTLKKWIAIHFFKMRLLQLEIRRKLYLRKRPSPRSDKHPWFTQMLAKLNAWRDATPSTGDGVGPDKTWFVVRYNTIIVFLYRPSPQVPRPSVDAALLCYDACEFNINLQRAQIDSRTVDQTWVFTQTIFMAINTILWALSYDEVRRQHSRDSVEACLSTAMEAISLTSDRWPGVLSAMQLYHTLIHAVLKIYERDGDVVIAASPSEKSSPTYVDPLNRSLTTSPATADNSSIATPPDHPAVAYFVPSAQSNVEQQQPQQQQPSSPPYQADAMQHLPTPPAQQPGPDFMPAAPMPHMFAPGTASAMQPAFAPKAQLQQQQQHQPQQAQQSHPQYYDPHQSFNQLPQFNPHVCLPGWTAPSRPQVRFGTAPTGAFDPSDPYANQAAFDPSNPLYPFPATTAAGAAPTHELTAPPPPAPDMFNAAAADATLSQLGTGAFGWDDLMDVGTFGAGLTQSQQEELLISLENSGMQDIQSMIASTMAAIAPRK